MEELTTLQSYLKASNADGLAILEATAPWCSQCKAMAPFISKLQTKYPEARFYNYNTDRALDISQELGANQMPTFHIFKDGDLKESVTGAKAKELETAIAKCYDGTPVEEV
ncbi:related to thioredoxin Trx1 [Ramularia collo-cygni]|uniref:Related to thioredoxin Trx1 n=1 Tax=Ramularia collo-cygni TaxID=112498 RepID=A0A2D3VI25_9PEZI|nr:related to thioredoxin Trx1 [Ramularia collo-cygni]CZT20433.1 related to thioredoxin Trx1 [Ramularia collo-cygni]